MISKYKFVKMVVIIVMFDLFILFFEDSYFMVKFGREMVNYFFGLLFNRFFFFWIDYVFFVLVFKYLFVSFLLLDSLVLLVKKDDII